MEKLLLLPTQKPSKQTIYSAPSIHSKNAKTHVQQLGTAQDISGQQLPSLMLSALSSPVLKPLKQLLSLLPLQPENLLTLVAM